MKDSRILLGDILERIARIERLATGRSVESYANEPDFADLIDRNLEIIGEAVRKLPTALTDLRTEIPWRDIVAMRNILVHNYDALDPATVWDVVTNKLSALKSAVEAIRQTLTL